MTRQRKMYGTWDSPIGPQMMAGSGTIDDVQWDTDGKTLVCLEKRGGKNVLVAQSEGDAPRDLTEPSVHPIGAGILYGGGEFTVAHGIVLFVSKGRLYRLPLAGGVPQPITPGFGSAAAPVVSADGHWVAFAHSYEDVDGICVVDAAGEKFPRKIAYGTDFVMQPTWHPQGTHLAYIAWNFPQMAFNGTQLRLVTMAYDTPGIPYGPIEETLTGDTETAIFQPEFSPDGQYLAYVSDVKGWGHLYLYDLGEGTHTQLTQGEHEHGSPAWVQGLRQYAWSPDNSALVYLRNDTGFVTLWRYDFAAKKSTQIDIAPYTFAKQLALAPDGRIALIVSSSHIPTRLILVQPDGQIQVVRRSMPEALPTDYYAIAEAIAWRGHDGETAHGLYYPPQNPDYEGVGTPPLIVMVHGGPTSQRFATFYNEVVFFTSRGFAVLHINHRGGTGYGKAYMNKHAGGWGIYDVEDSLSGAQYLVDTGRADPTKLVIMGGSAGGYTVLQSLVDKPGFYKAGVNLYGVANQFTLAMDTHKFEARYSDWLLGELPEAAAVWRDRSPIFAANKIQDACIVFQGADDKVVPKSQSDAIVAALRKNGVPHEYYVYEGEGHGFRKPETIADYYTKLLRFLLVNVLYA
jgi:dipeptidyl aminopeptidase/acylaminoacyl peptidase